MNYREKIRKAIECPQLNNTRYGEWAALTLEQRKYIERLLDELDSADNYFKKVYLENQELKEQLEDMTLCRDIASGHRQEVQDRETLLLKHQKEFIKYLEDEIYSIEPKGTGIIYNCEYDSEEDYVNAMKEQSRLNTLKEILQKYKSTIGVK